MKQIIQVHITKGDDQFVAECLDLPVVTQGKTLDELMVNLQEAIALHLEDENLMDLGFTQNPSILVSFEFNLKTKINHAKTYFPYPRLGGVARRRLASVA